MIALASEWSRVEWWSPVRLPPPTGPHQDFAVLTRGMFMVGRRGTAGFFTRAIPPAGLRFGGARPTGDPWWVRACPWPRTAPQLRAWSVPLWTPGLALTGLGGWSARRARRLAPGTCARCGYDLAGLAAGVCPECGRGQNS